MNERIVDSFDASATNSTTMTVINCMENHLVFFLVNLYIMYAICILSFVYLYKACPNTEANPMLITTHAPIEALTKDSPHLTPLVLPKSNEFILTDRGSYKDNRHAFLSSMCTSTQLAPTFYPTPPCSPITPAEQ